MANAKIDENGVRTALVALNTDGTTLIRLKVNPTNHAMKLSDGTTGSDHGPKNAPRDENSVPAMMGVSSADFKTPMVIYGDTNGNLLGKST